MQSAKTRAERVGVRNPSFDQLGFTASEVEEICYAREPLAASVQQQHEAEDVELGLA